MIEVGERNMPELDKFSWRLQQEVKAQLEKIWPEGYGFIGLDSDGFAYFQRNRLHTESCQCGRCPLTEASGPLVGKIAL